MRCVVVCLLQMRMDQYFTRIQKIITEKKTVSRVCFMLRDVVDLRNNRWVPRRDESAPKTIHQIHKEAHEEKMEKAVMAQRQMDLYQHQHPHQASRRGRGQ